ncbi:MAG TPA: hypothetical protein V6C96_01370, partial [Vampirovibrionales bacterium]
MRDEFVDFGEKISTSFQGVKDFNDEIIAISSNSSTAATSLKKIVDALSFDGKKIGEISGEQLSNLRNFLDTITTSISKISGSTSADAVRSTSGFVKVIEDLLNSVFQLAKAINFQKGVEGNTQSIEQGILDVFGLLVNSSRAIAKSVPIIAAGLNSLSKLPNTQVIRNSAEAVESLTQLLVVVSKLKNFSNLGGDSDLSSLTGLFDGFDVLGKSIAEGLEPFSKISFGIDFRRVSGALEGFAAFLKVFPILQNAIQNNIEDRDNFLANGLRKLGINLKKVSGSLSVLPQFTRAIAKSLNGFTALQISPQGLESLATGLDSFGRFLPRIVSTMASISNNTELQQLSGLQGFALNPIRNFIDGAIGNTGLGGFFKKEVLGFKQVASIANEINVKFVPTLIAITKGINRALREVGDLGNFKKFARAINDISNALEKLIQSANTGELGEVARELNNELPKIFAAIQNSVGRSIRGRLLNIGLDIVSEIVGGLKNVFVSLMKEIGIFVLKQLGNLFKFVSRGVDNLFDLSGKFEKLGKNISNAFKRGVDEDDFSEATRDGAQAAIDAAEETLQIQSPSR